MSFWFDAENRTHPSSSFAFINIINNKIFKLTVPSFVPRIPRKVSDYTYQKASELKIFLLVYSSIILKNVMNRQYFEHHLLLASGITLLNSASITEIWIQQSKRSLTEQVRRFDVLYEKRNLTCNLHLLLHLPDNIKKFGPLWAVSCFPFENLNGILKSFVHGSRYAEMHICSSVTTFLSFT